jgi:arylsulfatase A-like enzyme
MNVVVICADTFRYDHLGSLGLQPVQTPHLDRLAAESTHFADFRLCSFPTLLNRIEVFSGRCAFPWFDWGPLPFQFPVLSEVFSRHGFTTALVSDNPHLMKPGFGYGRGFRAVMRVRGQAEDRLLPSSAPMIALPCPVGKLRADSNRLDRYRRNARWYEERGTNAAESVFREAMRWVDGADGKFLLWIDAFDPHEPWDAPAGYRAAYPWDDRGDAVVWPQPGRASRYADADLANMRSLYKAEVSQTDHWLGAFLDHLDRRAVARDTAVIFCSDHGVYLGEHDLVGKLNLGRPTPIYDELGRVPLLVRHPAGRGAGRTVRGLCQPPDLHATILDLAGIPAVPWSQGRSLAGGLDGAPPARTCAVGGCHPRRNNVGCLTVWSDAWCLVYSPQLGLDGSELFERTTGPAHTRNVLAARRSVAEAHLGLLGAWLDELGVPPRRRRQLLEADGFSRLDGFTERLSRWRSRVAYRTRFGA